MSKTSASNKQFRNDTLPIEHTRHQISSKSAFSNSKQPPQTTERSRLHRNGSQNYKSASKKFVAQQCKLKPIGSHKNDSKAICRVRTNSETAMTASRKRQHFHRMHHQSPAPTGSQPPQVENARLTTGIKIHRGKSLVSVNTRSSGSQKPRSQSNPSRTSRKSHGKLHSSKLPIFQPSYICEKHQRLTKTIHKAIRQSAGDSHLSELANDAKEMKPQQDVGTNQATPRPKPSSYTIPFVLTRKLKRGDDPHRIPADAIHAASVHKREYMRLRKQTSTIQTTNKDPNNCNIRVIKFHNVEIIEQHDPLMEQEGKVILKIIHKSRQLQQPQKRVNLISDEYTDLTKMMLEYIFKQWADVVKMWKLEGYLQQVEPYETVEFDAQQHQTPALPSPSSSSSSSPDMEQLPQRGSMDNIKQYVTHDQSQQTRKIVRHYLVKKGPAYQETITTQLRYNFRRKKRFYPVHLMEHVLKYKRPPFWNYSRNYRGFNVLLNKYQLDNLYELVPPRAI